MAKSHTKELTQKDRQDVARALEILFATDFISRRRLYLENFIRGLTFSIGTVLGATIGIALLLWILSLFKTVPLIGPLVRHAQQTIKDATH